MPTPYLYRSPINIPQDNFGTNPFQLFPTSENTVTNNNQHQQSEMTVLGPGQIGYLNTTNQSPPQPQPQPQPPQPPTSEEMMERVTESMERLNLGSGEEETNFGESLLIASLRQQLAEAEKRLADAEEYKQRRDAEITELKDQLDIEKNEKQMALNTIEYNKAEIDSLHIKYQENQQKYENVVLDRDIEIETLQEEVMEIKSEVDQVKIDMGRQNEVLCQRNQDLENEINRHKIEKETYMELFQSCVRY